MTMGQTQIEKLRDFMGISTIVRSRDLTKVGVSATTISRAVADGELMRIGRGIYQLSDAEIDTHATLIETAKRAPNAVICLMSALAYHGLTDQLPRAVWIAIGAKDWKPNMTYPKIRTVRFREPYFSSDVETRSIGGVEVRMYSITKSIADAFRNPKLVDRSVAIECLKSALEDRRASPSEIANAAKTYGAWNTMRPYLEALTSNG
jgi:predicted transcriptional regulator of viral defense system